MDKRCSGDAEKSALEAFVIFKPSQLSVISFIIKTVVIWL